MSIQILQRTAIVVAISACSCGALASGFKLQENSISGLGRAYAAQNTIGDDASILARNPAGSALFDRVIITGGIIYLDPKTDAEGEVLEILLDGNASPIALGSFEEKSNDFSNDQWLPNIFLAIPFNDAWSAGLGIYTDFGKETDFNEDALTTPFAKKTKLDTYTIAPSIAYNFADVFSIGIAANILYADSRLSTQYPSDLKLGSITSDLANKTELDFDGDDWDVSWSIGALWNITEHTRVGISYHSELEPKLEGDVSSDFIFFDDFSSMTKADGRITIDLPDSVELGFYHRFNARWGLALGLEWTDWDDFYSLELYVPGKQGFGIDLNPLPLRTENFESGWRYSVGVEFYPCETCTWRIGYAYDEGAARDGINEAASLPEFPETWRELSIPDSDRQEFTLGATYELNQQLSIDGGIAYRWGKKEKIDDVFVMPFLPDAITGGLDNTLITAYDGRISKIESWLFGVGLNYKF